MKIVRIIFVLFLLFAGVFFLFQDKIEVAMFNLEVRERVSQHTYMHVTPVAYSPEYTLEPFTPRYSFKGISYGLPAGMRQDIDNAGSARYVSNQTSIAASEFAIPEFRPTQGNLTCEEGDQECFKLHEEILAETDFTDFETFLRIMSITSDDILLFGSDEAIAQNTIDLSAKTLMYPRSYNSAEVFRGDDVESVLFHRSTDGRDEYILISFAESEQLIFLIDNVERTDLERFILSMETISS